MRHLGQSRAEAPAFLLSLLLNLGIVYGVATALQHTPRVFERIEVDLRETPPAAVRLRPPPQASRPPEAPAVPLPRPATVPRTLDLARPEIRSAPLPTAAPAALPVPAELPAPTSVPLQLARVGPPGAAPPTPERASVAPAPPVPAAAMPASDPQVLEAYYAQVRARIEAEKRYPRWARKARFQGRTTVGFRVRLDGALLEAEVRESSGHEALDRAALAAVERAAPFPPFPREAGEMPESLAVVVAFVLE